MIVSIEQVRNLYWRARAGGAVEVSPWCLEWHVAGNCSRPVEVVLEGRPRQWVQPLKYLGLDGFLRETYQVLPKQEANTVVVSRENPRLKVTLMTRCRKCPECLKTRANEWAKRARVELGLTAACMYRTWHCSYTFNPEARNRVDLLVYREMASKGLQTPALSSYEGLLLRVPHAKHELQLYFKRLRKAKHRFRYFGTVEPHLLCGDCKRIKLPAPCVHATYFPHFHVLIHERSVIRKRDLQEQWKNGFSGAKLVDNDEQSRAAWYVSKYIAKGNYGRIVASLRYGVIEHRAT